MNLEKTKNELPFVSVIMPVCDEEKFIEKSLSAVLRQTYPTDRMEIVIADGLSTDSTLEKIEKIKTQTTIPINIVENSRRIAPTGLNVAIRKSKGEIIVRVDGHCEIEPDYIANCVRYLQSNEAEGVGGPIETIGETLTARAIATAMSSKFGVGGSAFRTINNRKMFVDTVAFPGYTRKIIEKVGFFNEELVRNQDDEYNFRIRKFGGRILLAPDIRSRYYSRSNFNSLWRQYYQYGFWKVRVWQLHPRQMSWRQYIPLLFVFSLLTTATLGIFTTAGKFLFAIVVVTYLLGNLLASVMTAKTDFKLVLLLSLSFAILHFSYGFGFLKGLLVFRKHWSFSTKRNFSKT